MPGNLPDLFREWWPGGRNSAISVPVYLVGKEKTISDDIRRNPMNLLRFLESGKRGSVAGPQPARGGASGSPAAVAAWDATLPSRAPSTISLIQFTSSAV